MSSYLERHSDSETPHDLLISALEHVGELEDLVLVATGKDKSTALVWHTAMKPSEVLGLLKIGAVIQEEDFRQAVREDYEDDDGVEVEVE